MALALLMGDASVEDASLGPAGGTRLPYTVLAILDSLLRKHNLPYAAVSDLATPVPAILVHQVAPASFLVRRRDPHVC